MQADDFLETFRSELQDRLQALLTYDDGGTEVKESTVVQHFQDVEQNYPMVYISFGAGNSPPQHIGEPDRTMLSADIFVLALRANKASHIITCEDGKDRSGRDLVEYVAWKVYKDLNSKYVPSFPTIDRKADLELNSDFEERDGVHRSTLQYQVLF